jgi:hypothetical protein
MGPGAACAARPCRLGAALWASGPPRGAGRPHRDCSTNRGRPTASSDSHSALAARSARSRTSRSHALSRSSGNSSPMCSTTKDVVHAEQRIHLLHNLSGRRFRRPLGMRPREIGQQTTQVLKLGRVEASHHAAESTRARPPCVHASSRGRASVAIERFRGSPWTPDTLLGQDVSHLPDA